LHFHQNEGVKSIDLEDDTRFYRFTAWCSCNGDSRRQLTPLQNKNVPAWGWNRMAQILQGVPQQLQNGLISRLSKQLNGPD